MRKSIPAPNGGAVSTGGGERGGKAQFPYLVDPNTGVEMYESLDIIDYLFDNLWPAPAAA